MGWETRRWRIEVAQHGLCLAVVTAVGLDREDLLCVSGALVQVGSPEASSMAAGASGVTSTDTASRRASMVTKFSMASRECENGGLLVRVKKIWN